MASGPTSASVSLYISGTPSLPVSGGAWGSTAFINTREAGSSNQQSTCAEFSGKLGHTSRHAAEYMAFIGAMRGLIRFFQTKSIRCSNAEVEIITDYKPFIDDMTGSVDRSTSQTKVLFEVAKGLQIRFHVVRYRHAIEARNARGHKACDYELFQELPTNASAVYSPCQAGLIDAWVQGKQTLGSHDLGTAGADPSFFVDAQFLQSCLGSVVLRNLDDPHPLSVVVGQARLSVLGTANLDVGMTWTRGAPDGAAVRPTKAALVSFVVVDSFPVPLHISTQTEHLEFEEQDLHVRERHALMQIPFNVNRLPPYFAESPFWTAMATEQ